jgi:plastocyanin
MNLLSLNAGLLALAMSALAGDVSVHAKITKRLTHKTLAPTVYDLRGTAPPAPPPETDSLNEFDQMVVMLEGTSIAPKAPVSVTIDQRDMQFAPGLVVIPVGSSIQFPNWDPIFHSVFSLSRAKPFDLGFYPRGQTRTVKFDRPGIVQVYCHIHANMYAAIVVTSSPWYGRPSEEGEYSWSDVPAGHYRLIAWHKIAGLHQKEIDVPQTGKTEVTIRIPIDVESRR